MSGDFLACPCPVILDCQHGQLVLPFPGTHVKTWDAGSPREPNRGARLRLPSPRPAAGLQKLYYSQELV